MLKKIQSDFAGHIFDRKNNKITKSLPYSNQESLARLNIYRNNIFGTFSAVLESTFPITKKIIGTKKFKNLVEIYQKKYPAHCGDLNKYPDNFPKILQKLQPSFLYDLSRLELASHQSYYADDMAEFAINSFHKIKPENFYELTFDLHPSCFLIKSQFPIFEIFTKKQKILGKKTEFILVERASGSCKIEAITGDEFLFLEYILKKKSLFQIYKKITQSNKNFDIGAMLNKFINNRVICNFNEPKI